MSYRIKVLLLGIFMLIMFIILYVSFNMEEDNTFNDNLIMFETKSKDYVKYNLLPLTSEKVITLEELYDNKIIPKLYYKHIECNDKSYVVIRPKNNFYEMTTTLICDNKTEVIKSYFN